MAIFNRKKPADSPAGGNPVMRGRRDDKPADSETNPLARRLVSDEEPDTIDLDGASGFPAAGPDVPDEPETRAVRSAGEETPGPVAAGGQRAFLSRDPATGKFYVQPGTEGCPVFLGDEPVLAPTELRRGDRLRIGDAEFEFLL